MAWWVWWRLEARATDSILCALRAGHVVVGMSPKLTGRQRHGGCVRVSRLMHQASHSSCQAVGKQHLLFSGPREIQQGEEAVMRARFCLALLTRSTGRNRSLFCLCCQSLGTPGTPGRWSPWPAVCTCFIHKPH